MERTVTCMDAMDWLDREGGYKAIITSLPDMEEVGMVESNWSSWILNACFKLQDALDDDGVIFFYQTDRRFSGRVIDKKNLISKAFSINGYSMILSKVVLKREPEVVSLFRPSYTNLFAFSRNITSGKPTPDVIRAGNMLYKNAMGFDAIKMCLDFISNKVDTDTILDPFCGMGSVLKVANDMGFHSVGVDIDKKQCKEARKL